MVKNKKKCEYDGIEFDSDEEIEFYIFCQYLKKFGFIRDFKYNFKSYQLSDKKTYTDVVQLKTKTKKVEKHLLHPHEYTPDFWLYPTEAFKTVDFGLYTTTNVIIVDTKGNFQRNDGSRAFSINQKWMFDKHNIYVNKVIPEKLFKKYFCPDECKLTRVMKKPKKKYASFLDFQSWLKTLPKEQLACIAPFFTLNQKVN